VIPVCQEPVLHELIICGPLKEMSFFAAYFRLLIKGVSKQEKSRLAMEEAGGFVFLNVLKKAVFIE
jgi:hypothetical protein